MLIARVVDDQLDHHLHVALVGLIEKPLEVAQRPIRRIHIRVIRNVVSVIAQGGRKEGQQPDAGHSEVLQIVELRNKPRKIPDPVIIRVSESAHVDLVNNRVLVPERIGCACDLLHATGLQACLMRLPTFAGGFECQAGWNPLESWLIWRAHNE